MEEKHRCEGQVSDGMRFPHYSQCTRHSKVERDGHWYCGQHDPQVRKERFDARLQAEREESARQGAAWKRREVVMKACAGVEFTGDATGVVAELVKVLEMADKRLGMLNQPPQAETRVRIAFALARVRLIEPEAKP